MRTKNYPRLDSQFIERWSPRAFLSDSISAEDTATLFEAARWSPSCYNEQPWRFVYATQTQDLEQFRSTLAESNQVWANSAPLLVYLFSKKTFSHNNNPNRWADFDTGAAWMALSLQAHKQGLYTHAMGGFDTDKAYAVTGVDSQEFNVVCAIAIGKRADADSLPGKLQNMEIPNDRKLLEEVVFQSSMG
ncbi:MAG: nitroreductase family protein [Gammaproteobacteria bacterium]|nr:nitroreductase family protein [Gammaproteobacteria bacterium]MDH5800589.1 nitroreductase family protein [Gammaproteobacteria bacterium]